MNIKKEKALINFKKAQSLISKINKMVEEDKYCIDIIHQSLAVQKALKKLDSVVMADHIKHCVVDQAKKGNFDKITKELLNIYEYK